MDTQLSVNSTRTMPVSNGVHQIVRELRAVATNWFIRLGTFTYGFYGDDRYRRAQAFIDWCEVNGISVVDRYFYQKGIHIQIRL